MALNAILLSTEIQTKLAPFSGSQLAPFAQILGKGVVMALKGKLKYNSTDIGNTSGAGTATTQGIKGLSESKMSQGIFDKGQQIWQPFQKNGPGVEWKNFTDRLSSAIVSHLKLNATLSSAHSPVFVGAGTVKSYFGVTSQGMAGIITKQAPAQWQANRLPELALAVATGVMDEILTHSPAEKLGISGSGGEPSPGSGTGTGNVF